MITITCWTSSNWSIGYLHQSSRFIHRTGKMITSFSSNSWTIFERRCPTLLCTMIMHAWFDLTFRFVPCFSPSSFVLLSTTDHRTFNKIALHTKESIFAVCQRTTFFISWLDGLHLRRDIWTMRLFALGLVFLLTPTVYGLVCLKARLNFDLRSFSSQPGTFRDQIQALKLNMNTPSKTGSCQTNISVSYHQQQLTIISDDTQADLHVPWDYIYFDTTIWPTANWLGVRHTEHSSLAVYICSISDGCNKAGILNYLDWMISRDFDFFKINIVELLLGSGETSGKSLDMPYILQKIE